MPLCASARAAEQQWVMLAFPSVQAEIHFTAKLAICSLTTSAIFRSLDCLRLAFVYLKAYADNRPKEIMLPVGVCVFLAILCKLHTIRWLRQDNVYLRYTFERPTERFAIAFSSG